jgi:hypothetical protein
VQVEEKISKKMHIIEFFDVMCVVLAAYQSVAKARCGRLVRSF